MSSSIARRWTLAVLLMAGAVKLVQTTRVRAATPRLPELRLERVVRVQGPGDFQPSGLALAAGRLYTVSDKHSDAVYEILLGPDEDAPARAAVPIRLPGGDGKDLDLEGIALDRGDFLLASEARTRVLRVSTTGAATVWLPIDLLGPGRIAGLFATPGAGIEGVAVLGDRLIVAAERQPRGLMVAPLAGGPARALRLDTTRLRLPPGRVPDFADLCVDGGRLFALARNADAVIELRPDGDGFAEGPAWSFATTSAAYPYHDRRFGLAEGLAFDRGHVYVILDNNGDAREGMPSERRPLLFVFARPRDM